MKMLIAGGTGHTGERLVRRLLARGYEVRVLSRRSPDSGILGPLIKAGAIHAPGDCTQRWTLHRALEGCDILIGCAHIRYAEACVQACELLGVKRYLQMSSTRRFTLFPCVSSREVIEGEDAITASQLDYTILRATMIFGGRRDANMERMVQWFRRRRWFPVFGDGKNLIQPVFVEDLLDAFMAAIDAPEKSNRKSFTLAGPVPVTMREMIIQTAAACGVNRPVLIPVPITLALPLLRILPSYITRRSLSAEQVMRFREDKSTSIDAAQELLGYKPRTFTETIQLKAKGLAECTSNERTG